IRASFNVVSFNDAIMSFGLQGTRRHSASPALKFNQHWWDPVQIPARRQKIAPSWATGKCGTRSESAARTRRTASARQVVPDERLTSRALAVLRGEKPTTPTILAGISGRFK